MTSTSGSAPRPIRHGCSGGSYLVPAGSGCSSRPGTATSCSDQENVFGRSKVQRRAAQPATHEFDTAELPATGADGQPVIPPDAHIRLAAHENNGGLRILRRGYSFTDGIDP